MKKPFKIILLSSILFCFTAMACLPLFVQAQNDSVITEIDLNTLSDPKERSIYFFRKGVLAENFDVHYFRIPLREGKKYVARLWITAPDGGDFHLVLSGQLTYGDDIITTSENIKNELIGFEYISDTTTTGTIQIIYGDITPTTQKPTYTLYVNRAGFVGLWWIILSGIGILAVLTVLLTFAIIGMRSVAIKRQKKK